MRYGIVEHIESGLDGGLAQQYAVRTASGIVPGMRRQTAGPASQA
ncbi:MAG TPA: hypothetical protein VIH59_25895 [Candidatus Tectomicrobia bacterium]|jgi:hypothetical protein